MSNAIVTVIMVALMLSGVSLLASTSLTAVGNISESWKDMEVRSGALTRTDIRAISTSYTTPILEVTVENTGREALRNFAKWDVLVQYYETDGTYHTKYLAYTTASPVADNTWGTAGIYIDASAAKEEAFQPNILDPSEEVVIRLKVSPSANGAANNLVVIGTPNGVTVSKPF